MRQKGGCRRRQDRRSLRWTEEKGSGTVGAWEGGGSKGRDTYRQEAEPPRVATLLSPPFTNSLFDGFFPWAAARGLLVG
jgi:hypothetical protein